MGSSFTTTSNISRDELIELRDTAQRFKTDRNIRVGLGTAIVTAPFTSHMNAVAATATSISSSGMATLLSEFGPHITDEINNILTLTTKNSYNVTITYEKQSRGQDIYYVMSNVSIG